MLYLKDAGRENGLRMSDELFNARPLPIRQALCLGAHEQEVAERHNPIGRQANLSNREKTPQRTGAISSRSPIFVPER
jgi:hypothetical protein